jgi:hypothetical protein
MRSACNHSRKVAGECSRRGIGLLEAIRQPVQITDKAVAPPTLTLIDGSL